MSHPDFRFLRWGTKKGSPDNLKTGIIKADLYDSKFNQGYDELAHHYGIIVDPARSGKPRDKARVERVILYIRVSFWSGRNFSSLEEINQQAMGWCLLSSHSFLSQGPACSKLLRAPITSYAHGGGGMVTQTLCVWSGYSGCGAAFLSSD